MSIRRITHHAIHILPVAAAIAFAITIPATASAQTTGGGSSGSWANEATQTMSTQGCDPTVAKAISQTQQANIKGRTQLANDLYKRVLANLKYETLSCLSNLLPSALFQIPSASSLRGQIESYVCQGVNQMVDPVVSNINSATGSMMGGVNSLMYQNLQLGPDNFNLGSVQTGFQLTGGAPLLTPIRSLYATDGAFPSGQGGGSYGGSNGNSSVGSILSNSTRANLFGRE